MGCMHQSSERAIVDTAPWEKSRGRMRMLEERRRIIAANRGSRGLAYLSTARYVGGLNCWVRNGSRCFPAAMAAMTQAKVRI